MSNEITFTMIKPDAMASGNAGAILQMITDAGFRIAAMKFLWLTEERARKFYEVHIGKVFYEPLIGFMTSGPVIAMVLEKENAVLDYRKLIGTTDPETAAEGTVRKLYATNTRLNAVHGSDSPENARIEADFFFESQEVFDAKGELLFCTSIIN
jgi:nucleoside-diphosphate kinase